MAPPPPSRVASSSTCNSKKHKVPPDRAGPNALLDSDCTARVQSNLSDDVVMGSPPHPWAPDSRRKGKYFASRPPLSLPMSLGRCASMSSCQGRQETLQQHVPEPCALKGTPHGLYYVCTLYQTTYSLAPCAPIVARTVALYRDQLGAISPHHTLTMSRRCHWTAHSALKLHLSRPRGPSSRIGSCRTHMGTGDGFRLF